jgi:hypothetical protein
MILYSDAMGHHQVFAAGKYIDIQLEAFMSKQSKGGSKSQSLIRKRMENSLPLSLSRWFAGLFRKKS